MRVDQAGGKNLTSQCLLPSSFSQWSDDLSSVVLGRFDRCVAYRRGSGVSQCLESYADQPGQTESLLVPGDVLSSLLQHFLRLSEINLTDFLTTIGRKQNILLKYALNRAFIQ